MPPHQHCCTLRYNILHIILFAMYHWPFARCRVLMIEPRRYWPAQYVILQWFLISARFRNQSRMRKSAAGVNQQRSIVRPAALSALSSLLRYCTITHWNLLTSRRSAYKYSNNPTYLKSEITTHFNSKLSINI